MSQSFRPCAISSEVKILLRTKWSRSLDTSQKQGGMLAESFHRPESPAPEAGVSAPCIKVSALARKSSKIEFWLRTRPETCQIVSGVFGPEEVSAPFQKLRGPESPGLRAGVSGVKRLQRLFFRGDYIKPSSSSRTLARPFLIADLKLSHENLEISLLNHSNLPRL